LRYSLENPRAYLGANVIGTFNGMEAARATKKAGESMADAYGTLRDLLSESDISAMRG
jgi:hypothetical protein